jgi:hypothetical protein
MGAKDVSASLIVPWLKRLTAAEMAAKRECGECYNCLMKGIYLVQMHDNDTTVADDRRISLHAITGVSLVEMMQLQVHIGESLLDGLIESGSTHLFIPVLAAWRLHLQPLP